MAVEITEEFVWQNISPRARDLSLIHISEPTRRS